MEKNKGKEVKEIKESKTESANETSVQKGFFFRVKRMIKIIFILLLLLGLVIGGLFLGAYLKFFDVGVVNEKLELYKYPVLENYFVKPEQAEADNEPPSAAKEAAKPGENVKIEENAEKVQAAAVKKTTVLTKEEIERQIKQRQQEEKKRISKLARLYEQMKPEDAAEILNNLSDEMVIEIFGRMDEAQVSKILVKFDSDRSARLTRSMYQGKPPQIKRIS